MQHIHFYFQTQKSTNKSVITVHCRYLAIQLGAQMTKTLVAKWCYK